jgi:glycosyltransferase involved in cell wall biosynthesis
LLGNTKALYVPTPATPSAGKSISAMEGASLLSAPEAEQLECSEATYNKNSENFIASNPSQPSIVDVFWPRVSVVIPAKNEARNLPHVFALIPRTVHEVILVDGHSLDDTVRVALELWPDVRIVRQNRIGKGNALACGFAAATGDIIAMVDADGSADPGEIPAFVNALLDGADFAKGTRSGEGGGSEDLSRLRRAGNWALSTLFNACYKTRYSDLCYGYNVFWRRHLPVLGLDSTTPAPDGRDGRLWGDGFEIETLIHIRVAKSGLKVTEVPSFERSRIHGVSNLNAFSDGMRVLRIILTERRLTRRTSMEAAARPENQFV